MGQIRANCIEGRSAMNWLITLHISLFVLAILLRLNGYLRGQIKPYIHLLLSGLCCVLILTSLYFGWVVSLITLGLFVLYYFLARPVGRFLAWRSLKRKTSYEIRPGEAANLSESDWNYWCQRLQGLSIRSEIALALEQNNLSLEDLIDHFRFICSDCNLGEELAWIVVSDVSTLNESIGMRNNELPYLQQLVEIHMRFSRL